MEIRNAIDHWQKAWKAGKRLQIQNLARSATDLAHFRAGLFRTIESP